MSKKILEQQLNEALKSYKDEMDSIVSDPYGKRTVTEGEMVEFAKQTLYMLDKFKTALLEHLD